MSGPIQPTLPDITIVTSQPVSFPKELTEQEMLSMTVEQLEAYSARVSTSIGWEYSTLQTYQSMQDAIDVSILQSQSTITGYDTDITSNSIILETATKIKGGLDLTIAGLDTTITAHQSSISGYDTEIGSETSTIASLQLESDQLGKELAASDANFVSSAMYYSTLYYDYLAKDLGYIQHVSSIQAESTFLAAALVEEATSLATYTVALATYTQASGEVDALVKQSSEIQSSLTQYKVSETQANANLQNTLIAINSLSTLYETSFNTQKYYQAVSTQGAAIEAFTNATALYNEATRMAGLYPTQKTFQDAKAIALQQLNRAVVDKDALTTQVTNLAAIVNVSQSASYEAILKGYQDTIDMETVNISTFGGRRVEAETSIRNYSTLYESAQKDVAIYQANINTYTAQYNSSIAGADVLTKAAAEDEIVISRKRDVVNRRQIDVDTYGLQARKYKSEFDEYMKISTLKKAEYDAAIIELANYSTFYDSTSVAVTRLTSEETTLRNTILQNTITIRTQSSLYERELVKQEAFQAIIDASLAAQELAAMQYRETYVRTKKINVQELYNTKVLVAVQTISTQNGTVKASLPAGSPFVPKAVDLNAPELTSALSNMNMINDFLASFNTIYQTYDTRATSLNGLSTIIANKQVTLESVLSARDGLDAKPLDTALQQTATSAVAALAKVQGDVQTAVGNASIAKNAIASIVQEFNKKYVAVFSAGEIIGQESTISSFLKQGYDSAPTI
jgi:hypothetical protein